MRWKILALLPCTLCGNLAFGQLPGGDPSTEATFSYILFGQQNGFPNIDIAGSGTGPTSPVSWNFVDSVESFPNPDGGSAQVSVFPVPWVAASASSVAPVGPLQSGFGSATNYTFTDVTLQYYVQVNGPPSTTPITVFWNGAYSLTGATTGIDGFTYVRATVGASPEFMDSCEVEAGCASGVTSVFTGSLAARPTSVFQVGLSAVGYSENGGEAGFAYIDPYFYLSPAEVAAGDSLSFSASLGNAPSTVPLPATDGLLLTGLGMLTIASLRRNPSPRASRS